MPNPLASDLPFLPGNTFDFDKKPENYRKSHVLDYRKGVPFVEQNKPKIGGTYDESILSAHTPKTSLEIYSKLGNHSKSAEPSWIVFDRKVLRFYAFFQESVNERREETFRIRKCNIYFYLEDDSIHVSEPRSMNSGIPQGVLISRHRIPLPSDEYGQHYNLTHFNVNGTVTFYGKTFKIIGCDSFTRDFLGKLNFKVPENTSYPLDPYEEHRKELASRMVSAHHHELVHTLKKFFEHDRHVLRFYCLWDDTLSMFGEARQMVLHYFLADDTVEISERVPHNSGRDSRAKTFLRRGKLPKNPELFSPDAPTSKNSSDYYVDRDFSIGNIISVYGRKFIVCDVDNYTREYYHERYGTNMGEALTFDEEDVTGLINVMTNVPPYNGFGSEEDSLGSCTTLIPKPPRKDFKKLMALDQVVLRFEAKLISNRPVDKERKFIICYYVADESVQVFEPHQRNTGIVGGKFLERTRLRKKNGTYFSNSDFYLGAIVECFGHEFVLERADEYALNYMTSHVDQFPHSNLTFITKTLNHYQTQIKQALAKEVQGNVLSISKFKEILLANVPNINSHSAFLVGRANASQNDRNYVSIEKFLASIQ